jgi:hypothetical protein
MDIIKEFEEYLPKWAEEKMQPIPTQEHPDRWSMAWNDFINEHLSQKRDELVQDYLNMQFKTVGDRKREKAKKAQAEEVVAEIPVKQEEPKQEKQSAWDRIQSMLDS